MKTLLWIHAVASAAALLLWGVDKARAVVGRRRMSESTLFLVALLGGWPGALVGSWLFHHKSSKRSFRLVLWAIVALHAIAWALAWRAGLVP